MNNNYFINFLKLDWKLLNRNSMVILSFVMALIYVGAFYLLKPIGSLDIILVVLLFNDPVVTGFLFAGVMLLFDKNQNTLQALRILPSPVNHYIWSKALILSALATITGLIMTLIAHGPHLNYINLFFGIFGMSLIFTFAGFIFGSFSNSFNNFLLYIIAFMVPMALPMLWLFDVLPFYYFSPVPSMAGLILLKAALTEVSFWELVYAYAYTIIGIIVSYKLAVKYLSKAGV